MHGTRPRTILLEATPCRRCAFGTTFLTQQLNARSSGSHIPDVQKR